MIVCAPDTKLGPSIVAKCEEKNLKLMSVDDRLVDAGGKPLDKVAHLGISASEIGKSVGEAIVPQEQCRPSFREFHMPTSMSFNDSPFPDQLVSQGRCRSPFWRLFGRALEFLIEHIGTLDRIWPRRG